MWTSREFIVGSPLERRDLTREHIHRDEQGSDGSFFARLTSPVCCRVADFSDVAPTPRFYESNSEQWTVGGS
jgi:hypothetical protein